MDVVLIHRIGVDVYVNHSDIMSNENFLIHLRSNLLIPKREGTSIKLFMKVSFRLL